MRRDEEGSERDIRSSEPVQNCINANIWVIIYIEISNAHIFIYENTTLTHTGIQTTKSQCDVSTADRDSSDAGSSSGLLVLVGQSVVDLRRSSNTAFPHSTLRHGPCVFRPPSCLGVLLLPLGDVRDSQIL
ncbi:unnamed protein product [Arctogadus glacialis]